MSGTASGPVFGPEWALSAGWSVIPVGLDKKPLISSWKPYQDRQPRPDELKTWLKKLRPPAWALVTGEVSRRISLDFDGEAGAATMRSLGIEPHRQTPSGGYHADFVHPGWPVPTLNSKSSRDLGARWPGLDPRGDRGYVVILGRGYQWLRGPDAYSVDILPRDLQMFLGLPNPSAAGKVNGQDKSNNVPDGRVEIERLIRMAVTCGEGRNKSGFWLAVQLRDNRYDKAEAHTALRSYQASVGVTNTKGQREAYTESEMRATLDQVYSQPPRDPWAPRRVTQPVVTSPPGREDAPDSRKIENLANLPYTDLGNEQGFESLHGDDFLYNVTSKEWMRFNGVIWQPDRFNQADRAMLNVAKKRLEATATLDNKERKRAETAALRLQNVKNRKAAIESARSNPRFAREASDFDQEDLLFACANGVLNLQTGEFRRGRREDMLTNASGVEWNPTAPFQEWLRFLGEVFPHDPDMIPFLQSAIGYSLTGLTQEEVLFILFGRGRNGKGTFLRILSAALGDYAANTEFNTLVADRPGGSSRAPRNDIAAMAGKRFVTAQESREGARLDEAIVKSLTGGDLVTARFLNKEFFTFRPSWKIWLATNHRPDIRGTDNGIWSRPRLIPFTVSFEGREDKGLKERLLRRESLSGVLNWAAEGCRQYLAAGKLVYPDVVTSATAEYKNDSDIVKRFLDECCLVGDQCSSKARPLYGEFLKWTTQTGEEAMTETAFGRRMLEKGFTKKHLESGNRYEGVGIRVVPQELWN